MRKAFRWSCLTMLLVGSFLCATEGFSSIRPQIGRRDNYHFSTSRRQAANPSPAASTSKPVNVKAGTRGAPVAIAGRIGSNLKKISLIRSEFPAIRRALASSFDAGDALLLAAIGFLAKPLARRYFNWRNKDEKFEDSMLCDAAITISQLATVTGIVYLMDMAAVVLSCVGVQYAPRVQSMMAGATYLLWGIWRVRNYKQFLLRKAMQRSDQEGLGKARTIGYLLDVVIAVCAFFFLEDIFQFSLGRGLTSILTAGGTAAVVVSLASKSLATAFVNGLTLHASNKFKEGDWIVLGDGTAGTVVKMSLLETRIKGPDGVVTRISNEQITSQRIQNLSETPTSQVKQTLWFTYKDVDKIPTVMEDIRDEIRASCPRLITDGSAPFRVYWAAYNDDHLDVEVNVNFYINPCDEESYSNQQAVMEAISRAVKKSGVEFAIPNYVVKNENMNSQS